MLRRIMSQLAGSSVLITGASSGIGAELARQLVGRGCRVGLLARRRERLAALAEELEGAGGTAAWAVADVADGVATQRALDALAEGLGGADVVVANAGYGEVETPKRFAPGKALALYDVNLRGTLHVIDWALPRFLEAGRGHLVGVASVASYLGLPHFAAYCGSKAAMRIHLQSLRVSLARRGIAVTTICPGFVKSELTDRHQGPMPFLLPTDRAVRRIVRAIEKRQGEVVFPWQMRLVMAIGTCLPASWVEALLRRSA
ncbi:MAG: SDR family NAD(P)-dependent oxidoreductase [Acidobacteria bacterium]|nr:MAG: SDR family NAD(P)-dependent oxidoreductase [Acidobacteriota bacterium]